MSNRPEPIERRQFEMQQLVKEHPPVWNDRNKRVVFEIACPPGSSPQGRLDYSRWAALPWPESLDPKSAVSRVEDRPGFYDYTRASDRPDAVEWHVNDIQYVLATAFTGFRAAVLESARSRGSECPVLVHTGFWGCGALGGNRILMTVLQILAAEMAGLERVVFHTGAASGVAAINDAKRLFEADLITGSPMTVDELIELIDAIGFEWGVSDGN
ncbi:MAG: hypothetical protein ACHRXM_31810 [Isosphaerales bacterium]